MEISGATACVLEACKDYADETNDSERLRAIRLLEEGDYQSCKLMAIAPGLADDPFFRALDYLCGAVSRPPSAATTTILREAATALADAVARDFRLGLFEEIYGQASRPKPTPDITKGVKAAFAKMQGLS